MKITEAQLRKIVRAQIRQELQQQRLEEGLGDALKSLWGKLSGKKDDAQAAGAATAPKPRAMPSEAQKFEAKKDQIGKMLTKYGEAIDKIMPLLDVNRTNVVFEMAKAKIIELLDNLRSGDVMAELMSMLLSNLQLNVGQDRKALPLKTQMSMLQSVNASYHKTFIKAFTVIAAIREMIRSNEEKQKQQAGALTQDEVVKFKMELVDRLNNLKEVITGMIAINSKPMAARRGDQPRRQELKFECKKYIDSKINRIVEERTRLRKLGMLFS